MAHRLIVGSLHERWEVVDRASATEDDRRRAMAPEAATRAMRVLLGDPGAGAELVAQLRAGMLEPRVSRSLARNHVGPAFLRAVGEGRVLVIAYSGLRVGQAADVVVITDDVNGKRRTLDHTRLVARLLHGQGNVHAVSDADELVSYLKGFASIRRLVLMLHGSEGDILVRGVHMGLHRLGQHLKGTGLRIGELVFEGCHVALGGSKIAAFMEEVQVERVTGYAAFHAWSAQGFVIHPGTTPEQLETEPWFKRIKRFLIPGQAPLSQLARTPGEHWLAYEMFTRNHVGGIDGFDIQTLSETDVARAFTRGMMKPHEPPYTRAEAEKDKPRELDTPIGNMVIVSFVQR